MKQEGHRKEFNGARHSKSLNEIIFFISLKTVVYIDITLYIYTAEKLDLLINCLFIPSKPNL